LVTNRGVSEDRKAGGGVSILDDARRLTKIQPLEEDQGRQFCRVCGEEIGGYPAWEGHARDCPWLSMPKIVAALEAADAINAAIIHLRAALEG
jgi:hypothetical protein